MASGELHTDFVRVFETHVDAIRAYCLRRLTAFEANDAVSEVFVVAWRRRDEMPSGAQLRPWLFGVAHNVVRTAQRGTRRVSRLSTRVAQEPNLNVPAPETAIVERVGQIDVRRALMQLRDEDREVLMLRAWEELTTRQIAVVLDISSSAAEKRVSRALTRLRQLLDWEDQE